MSQENLTRDVHHRQKTDGAKFAPLHLLFREISVFSALGIEPDGLKLLLSNTSSVNSGWSLWGGLIYICKYIWIVWRKLKVFERVAPFIQKLLSPGVYC